jgi:hypothetical protein
LLKVDDSVLCANKIQTYQKQRMRGSCVGDDGEML